LLRAQSQIVDLINVCSLLAVKTRRQAGDKVGEGSLVTLLRE
jgi:hypothetical protein